MAMQADKVLPLPPYSGGKGRVKSPSSRRSSNMSCGYSAVRSISCARGATFSRATRRTSSWTASCSSPNV